MKNTHILNLLQEVPKDIRLEVYKEALDIISKDKGTKSNSGYGLCLLLPCLLWDLDEFTGTAHNALADCYHQIKYCNLTWISLNK